MLRAQYGAERPTLGRTLHPQKEGHLPYEPARWPHPKKNVRESGCPTPGERTRAGRGPVSAPTAPKTLDETKTPRSGPAGYRRCLVASSVVGALDGHAVVVRMPSVFVGTLGALGRGMRNRALHSEPARLGRQDGWKSRLGRHRGHGEVRGSVVQCPVIDPVLDNRDFDVAERRADRHPRPYALTTFQPNHQVTVLGVAGLDEQESRLGLCRHVHEIRVVRTKVVVQKQTGLSRISGVTARVGARPKLPG